MQVFVKNKDVKVWFSISEITTKGLIEIQGKFPYEFEDTRYHRVYERLLTGKYVAHIINQRSQRLKRLVIDYQESAKHYKPESNNGVLPTLKVNWHLIFDKYDNMRTYKVKEQAKESIDFFIKHEDSLKTKAIKLQVERHKKGLKVPSVLLCEVLSYICDENKKIIRGKSQ